MNHRELHRADYQSYLLRLWRDGAQTTWRASLQSTSTDQTYQFASIEALFAFLSMHTGEHDAHVLVAPAPPQLEV